MLIFDANVFVLKCFRTENSFFIFKEYLRGYTVGNIGKLSWSMMILKKRNCSHKGVLRVHDYPLNTRRHFNILIVLNVQITSHEQHFFKNGDILKVYFYLLKIAIYAQNVKWFSVLKKHVISLFL